MAGEQRADTANYQMVSLSTVGDAIQVVVQMPKLIMTPREAQVHAAWLVCLAGDEEDFLEVLHAVERS
jgi:hypothetical protein